MTILQEIFNWSSANLRPWQKDAVGRLYADKELSQTDIEELYALALAEHGIPASGGLTVKMLQAGQFAAPPVPERLVQLVAIRNLEHVNALAPGVRLPISPTGLTVIYGANGAGKSGYSRVLKKACRARDQKELILPDARLPPNKAAVAKAMFDVLVDGAPVELEWAANKASSPEELSEIAIFDARCARAYVDTQGDLAYAPYGLDILSGLAKVSSEVKERANAEKRINAPNQDAFASLAEENTIVGALLRAIPGKTTVADIEKVATLSGEESEAHTKLQRVLNEPDAKQKASSIRLRSKRYLELKEKVGSAGKTVDVAVVANLRKLIDASNAAKAVADAAAGTLQKDSSLLPSTGSDPWKELFESARRFSVHSHPGSVFPELAPDAACPLCQNPLQDSGVARLKAFDKFLREDTEKNAAAAKRTAAEAYRMFKGSSPSIQLDETLRQEISDADSTLPHELDTYANGLLDRHSKTLEACAGSIDWAAIPPIPTTPSVKLQALASKLEEEAQVLEASTDATARQAIAAQFAELDARKKLIALKSAVTEAIVKNERCGRLQSLITSLSPQEISKISRKATELASSMAKQEVADALNSELKHLNIQDLKVVIKPESPGGKTQFKLALELPGAKPPAEILSEGEQRAISIAAFLAEVMLGKGKGGVVFDDPVSSLDHNRRQEVSRRLVEESRRRQVVVFTHDIYFLFLLSSLAEAADLPASVQYIRQTKIGFGDYSADLPFDTLSTAQRLKALNVRLDLINIAHSSGDKDDATALTRNLYADLRDTWERAVEDELFYEVVQRFLPGISTTRLNQVVVEDSDYQAINAGMTRCSMFVHDPSKAIHLSTPPPSEIAKDIGDLATWRKGVIERRKSTRERRS